MSNNEAFDGQILADKLTKLNSSQQSIESLSRWCISHRKKAKQIVETWDKCFNSSQKDQRVSFLYLANDILQNSRRKGSEFVNEFWKFLPAALKHVYENGDGHGKKVATRLVDIWEERKVFGSRGQSLKDEMMGKNPPALPVSNGKSSNPIKIVKRDAHSVRIKLAVGGLPEKILTAFQPVLEEHLSEEAALNKCSAAVHHVGKIDEDVENTLTHGTQQGSTLLDDLKEQEDVLNQSVGQLENVEATRSALVSQLKEALQDQESELELVRTQLQWGGGTKCDLEDCCLVNFLCVQDFLVYSDCLLLQVIGWLSSQRVGVAKWIGIFDSEEIYEEEIEELAALFSVMENVQLSAHRPDRRTWKLDSSGVFSCKTFLNFLAD